MNAADDNSLNIQQLRAEAHRFFGELKSELGSIEDDLDVLNRELATLNGMEEKLAREIGAIEEDAVERMDRELIGLLNKADEETDFEMGMG
ncbi:MAG: hypothetical protein AAB417_04115 [Patescibacteria group bacterium]